MAALRTPAAMAALFAPARPMLARAPMAAPAATLGLRSYAQKMRKPTEEEMRTKISASSPSKTAGRTRARYQVRPPRYYRGPLHPIQPPKASAPNSREFVPGPFARERTPAPSPPSACVSAAADRAQASRTTTTTRSRPTSSH